MEPHEIDHAPSNAPSNAPLEEHIGAMSGGHFSLGHVANDNSRMHIGDAYHGNPDSNLFADTTYASTSATSAEGSSRARKRRRSDSSDDEQGSRGAKELLDSLYYDGFDYRKESLEGPQPQTFEWIFQMSGEYDGWKLGEDRHVRWPSFPQWLENRDSSNQYCILGKAGSGKSTLMAWISRDQVEQTVSHLRVWAGSRPVYILTHFLFRPSGNALGRNFEGLLRSILFQVLSTLPELQLSTLTAEGARYQYPHMTKWPIRHLKKMLKNALHSATRSVFCIFIDGIDELQDECGLKVDPNELVQYLLELQMPDHVKLCVSSRPTVQILTRLSSVSATTLQLTDPNRHDILTYVRQAMQSCNEVREPDVIAYEICTRADGVFLWAVFAVRQILKWADTENMVMLRQRLDKMGAELEDILAYMFTNIEKEHLGTLAFYLKVMKCSRLGIIMYPPSVALLVASQEALMGRSYKSLAERCGIEERRITQWSHGLLEVHHAVPFEARSSWVPQHSQHTEPLQRDKLTGSTQSWTIRDFDYYSEAMLLFSRANVSWLHRSAYDFFFSPTSQDHAKRIEELLGGNDDNDTVSALVRGHRELLWMLPHACNYRHPACLVCHFHKHMEVFFHVAARHEDASNERYDDIFDELLMTLLTYRHQCARSVSVTVFRWFIYELELRSITGQLMRWACAFEGYEPVDPHPDHSCTVQIDHWVSERGTLQQTLAASDARGSIYGIMSEAGFWNLCARTQLSYTMRRCTGFHERRAGGLMLACILHAIEGPPQLTLSTSVIEAKVDTSQLLHCMERWIEHYLPTTASSLGLCTNVPSYLEAPHMIMSWNSRQTNYSDNGTPGKSRSEDSHGVFEEFIVELLASTVGVSQKLSPGLSRIIARWDVWLRLPSGFADIRTNLNVMAPAAYFLQEDLKGCESAHKLRLMLGDLGNGWTASHDITEPVARWMQEHCISFGPETHGVKMSVNGFLKSAEHLLRDIHRNLALPIEEKNALMNAVYEQAVNCAEAHQRDLVRDHTGPMSDKEKSELAWKAQEAGQAERERLMSLVLD